MQLHTILSLLSLWELLFLIKSFEAAWYSTFYIFPRHKWNEKPQQSWFLERVLACVDEMVWIIFAGIAMYWDESVTNVLGVYNLSGRQWRRTNRERAGVETPPPEDVCGVWWHSQCQCVTPRTTVSQWPLATHWWDLIKLTTNNWYCGHNYSALW